MRFAVSPAPGPLQLSIPLAWRVRQVNDSPMQFKWRYAFGIGLAVAAEAACAGGLIRLPGTSWVVRKR